MRRALTALAIGIVVSGCSGKSAHTTAATSESCVAISAAAAIARVRGLDGVPATATVRAKLFGTDYWAVEVASADDKLTLDAPGASGHVGWAVFNVDADTGDLRGINAGPPGSTPSDWNSLPNRTSSCTSA
jgi:hypothetical protein